MAGIPDLSHLSDDELKAIASQKAPDLSHLTDEDLAKIATDGHGKAQTALESFANGAAFGYLPQLQAAAAKPIYGALNAITGNNVQPDSYVDERDQNIQRQDAEAKANPDTAWLGDKAGMITSGIATSGLLPGVAPAASRLGKVGQLALQGAKTGAIYGAVSNPGDRAGEIDPIQAASRVENAGAGAALGGVLAPPVHGAVALAAKGAGLVADVVPWAAAKIGKVFASVPEDTTGRYIKDSATINAAPERAQIADNLLDLKNSAENKVIQAHDDLANAKGALSENKADVRAGLQDEKFDLNQKTQEAQRAFDEKKQAFKEALKSNSLTSMAGDVHSAVNDLKDQVIQGSKDSYDILSKSNGVAPTKPLINVLQNHIDAMTVNGVPASTSAEQSIKEIQAMQARLGQMGESVSMPQAKQILQGLDKDIQYNNRAGAFAPQSDQAFSAMRSALDQSVKAQVPEYAAKMNDVARQTQLLSKASDLYGTPEKAISNLNGITSEKGQVVHAPILQQLGQETGKDLASPVRGYILNDQILKTPSLFDKAIEEIPEAKGLNSAKAKLAEVSDPAYARAKIEASNEPFQKKIEQVQAALDQTRERANLFSGITPDSVTAKTKALGGANDYGASAKFGAIDKNLGTDFQKQIQARNDLDQFKKTDGAGSRKTLLGAILGAPFGLMGAEIGATAGAVGDKFSGQVYKYALDKGITAAEAAKRLAPGAKNALELGGRIMPALAGQSQAGGAMGGAAASNAKSGPSKWANDGHSNLIKHADNQQDKKVLIDNKDAIIANPKTRQLLIQASDLRPGTKAMSSVMSKVKSKIESGG